VDKMATMTEESFMRRGKEVMGVKVSSVSVYESRKQYVFRWRAC
jgi:hypothetical protein